MRGVDMPPATEIPSARSSADGSLAVLPHHDRRFVTLGLLRLLGRSLTMLTLLTASYYLLPDQWPHTLESSTRTGGAIMALLGVAFVVRAQVRSLRSGKWPFFA